MISSHPHRNYTLVIDLGYYRSHIGFAGEESPQCSTYSYVYLDKSLVETTYGIGDYELKEQRGDIEIKNIFKQLKSISNKGHEFEPEYVMQFIERAILDKLKLSSQNISILFTEDSYLNQGNELVKQREKILEIMFEQFNIFNVCFLKKPVLTSLSVAKNNCIVVDSGHTSTRVSIVQDGYTVYTDSVSYGGKTLNSLIKQITGQFILPLQTQSYHSSYIDFKKNLITQQIKHSFVSDIVSLFKDNTDKMICQSSQKISYTLPDGQQIQILRSDLCDPFVNYPLYYKKYLTFSELDAKEVDHIDYKASPHYRSLASFIFATFNTFLAQQFPQNHPQHAMVKRDFLKHIVLTGGNMLFADLSRKLTEKLKQIEPDCHILIPPIYSQGKASNNSSPFIGGSIVAQLPIFNNFWIGQNEWKQAGSKSNNDKGQNSMVINLSQVNKNVDTSSVRAARNNLVSKKCP